MTGEGSNMTGEMLRGRRSLLGGVLMLPNIHILEDISRMVLLFGL